VQNKLALNSTYTLTANLLVALSNWLLLVIIAKKFPDEFLGQFVICLSLISPIFLLLSLKLRTVIVVDFSNENTLEQYIGTRLITSTLALVLCISVGSYLFEDIPMWLFLLVSIYKFADSCSELSYSFSQRTGRFLYVACSQGSRSILSIATMLVLAITTGSSLITIIGWTLTAILFSFVDLIFANKFRQQENGAGINWCSLMAIFTNFQTCWKMTKKYYPMSIGLVMGALFVYIPTYVIENSINIEAAGRFAAVSYFLTAGGVLVNSLSQAVSPKFSGLIQQGSLEGYRKLTLGMCAIGLAIGFVAVLVALVWGQFFLTLFYNAQIGTLGDELVWILIAASIRYVYIFIGTSMNSIKAFNIQTKIYSVGTSIVLLGCLWLVPLFGMVGAAYAMVIATAVECIIFVFSFNRAYRTLVHKRHLNA
jgi:O-antigen/teichoic acid export membrane protein